MKNHKLLDDDVEGAREERAFRMWINSLGLNDDAGDPIHINNLYEESKDGILMLRTLDKIKPSKKQLTAMKLLMPVKNQNITLLVLVEEISEMVIKNIF